MNLPVVIRQLKRAILEMDKKGSYTHTDLTRLRLYYVAISKGKPLVKKYKVRVKKDIVSWVMLMETVDLSDHSQPNQDKFSECLAGISDCLYYLTECLNAEGGHHD